MAKIFLSYSSKDSEFAKRLRTDLEGLGHSVWLDSYAIKVGDCIVSRVETGVREADYVTVVLSPDSVRSGWVEREWKAKFWDGINSGRTLVLPILLVDCEVPFHSENEEICGFSSKLRRGPCSIGWLYRPAH